MLLNNHFNLTKSFIGSITRRCLTSSVNPIAQKAFGRNKDVAIHYDNSRPNYSPQTIEKVSDIINNYNQSIKYKPLEIVEVATGTGKFTKSFMKYEKINNDSQNNYTITEPMETFLGQLNIESIQSDKWKIDKYVTSSDKLHMIKDKSCDAVIAAQSFHWMSNIQTLREFNRVLSPNCPIIFVWNSFDVRLDYINQIENIIDSVYKKIESKTNEIIPRYRTMKWEEIFTTNNMETKKYFKPLKKWQGIQNYSFTQENVLNHCSSISVISSLPDDEKIQILERIKFVLNNHDSTKGKEYFDFQYNIDIAYALSI